MRHLPKVVIIVDAVIHDVVVAKTSDINTMTMSTTAYALTVSTDVVVVVEIVLTWSLLSS